LRASLYYTELQTKNKETNKEIEFQPERTAQAGLDYKVIPALNLGVFAKYIGKQHYTDVLNRGATKEATLAKTTDAFALVDLRADYKFGKTLTLYGGVNNLTDKGVENIIGSNVGRYYFVGARAKF
ncbi:MAG: TonB-dependent receptor, partial [Sulfurimonas sp.]|nr:TonB-dependent receptor [Sulfurimonas sp.]